MTKATDNLTDGGYVIVNKPLIKQVGINAAILYGELCEEHDYWEERGETEDGWFYSTVDNVKDAISLGHKPQINAIKTLQDNNLIDVKIKGVPQKRYFKILSNHSQMEQLIIPKGNDNDSQTTSLIMPDGNDDNAQMEQLNIPKWNDDDSQREQLIIPKGHTNNNKNNNKNINNINNKQYDHNSPHDGYKMGNNKQTHDEVLEMFNSES